VAPIDDWSPKVNDPCRQTEVRRALTDALDALPPDARTAVILRDVEGLSVAEVAAALGVTVASAKARVHRARLVLRQHLAGSLR
jgi:RNA polymerase sigma-70 factor (ECF subfamily)